MRVACPKCSSRAVSERGIGAAGTVRSSVALEVSTTDYVAPYCIGFVELAEGPSILTRLEGVVAQGDRVYLKTDVSRDLYWFGDREGEERTDGLSGRD